MSSTRRIIVICSGNICRSPMAVALLRHSLEERDIPAVVISGGTLGIHGRRASSQARRAITELDAEDQTGMVSCIAEHRSQGLSPAMLEMADELVVMAPRHERYIRQMAPRAADRIVRLWEFAEVDIPLTKIPDPVGQDFAVFRRCRDLIAECLERWIAENFHQT